MKIPILFTTILAHMVLVAQSPSNLPSLELTTVTFTVVDPAGQPVEGARIEASRYGPGNAEGKTDESGRVSLQLSKGRSLTVYVSKDGYYKTGGELFRGGLYKGPERKLIPREIADAYTIELKPVLDPVFMQHRRIRGNAPAVDRPVGFDLRVGDWVGPLGKGVTEDMFFHFHDVYVDGETFAGTMTITFPNEGDGIQAFQAARPFSMEFGSNLAPPNSAPLDGYEARLSYSMAHQEGDPYQSYQEKDRNYILRTRTKMDASGRILEACYGWIQGEIEFDPRGDEGPELVFSYFFNPDTDPDARSLEYNLHRPRK
ncbi:carboxypeptidase regulatory-like domain-containing protein [Puniceicoccales bacterium CK1056]|uniref:Carboxypeptidase regulatory-like domain-containing protein n=1 Tax=Oceanipulchritudo coccoides TaxID=2706888 RepID=A0A6B2M0G6_9BACT|nr:carboxypeptidase-like regulatory domain-containing protein [Oceanipulchritudo coccoides]NDV61517.1 carboxypeptidase regulatory-like domain-containing protein [Oceanipulchritudo coccoides]